MGLQLSADEAVLICDQFDPDDEDCISFKKFLQFCTLNEEGAEAIVDYVRDRLLQDCRTRAGNYDTVRLFRSMTGSSTGSAHLNRRQNRNRIINSKCPTYLSWHDFYSYITRRYALHLATPRRRRLQKELQVTRSGRIHYKSFCSFLGMDLTAQQLGIKPMQVDPAAFISGYVFLCDVTMIDELK